MTTKIPEGQRPAFWLAFNAALKVEMKKVGAYKPESTGQDNAERMLVSIRDEWKAAIAEEEVDLYDFATATDAAKACATWHVNTRLAQAQEHTTDNEKPLFGMFDFEVSMNYSGGGKHVDFKTKLACTPDEFPFEVLRLMQLLDTRFKQYNMARVKPTIDMVHRTDKIEKPDTGAIGQPTVQRLKATEIHHNSDKGKSQWRVLTAVYQPYGIPMYDVPEEWVDHIPLGQIKKTDKWSIDVLMVWDEAKGQYKPKKAVAAFYDAPTGV